MATILVVDDMPVFREPIAAALRAKGYETICAEDDPPSSISGGSLLFYTIPEDQRLNL